MEINKKSQAGSLESSDLMVYVEPFNEIKIEVESSVSSQHTEEIRSLILNELEMRKINGVYVKIQDNGAMNLTIKARLKTALLRGAKNGN
jgi:citrate lyase subunit gamma (acyl carrier protein)